MTDEEISIEFEARLAFSGEPLKTCPLCGLETHRQQCPTCTMPDGEPVNLSGDIVIDEAQVMIESGADIEDLDSLLRYGFAPVER